MLPTPQDERRQFYLMPQDVDFSHAAAMFGPPIIALMTGRRWMRRWPAPGAGRGRR